MSRYTTHYFPLGSNYSDMFYFSRKVLSSDKSDAHFWFTNRQASEIRPPMFRHLLHLAWFWRERICPMYVCFYVPSYRCPPPSSNFGDERGNSWISVPLLRHVVRLRHQISETKGLNHEMLAQCCLKPGQPSVTLAQHSTNIVSTSRACWGVSLFFHQVTVSCANCVNATCLYSDCGIAYVIFKTFPQHWLNAPNV